MEACFHGSETSFGFRKVSSIFQVHDICCDLLEYLFYAKLWMQDFSLLQLSSHQIRSLWIKPLGVGCGFHKILGMLVSRSLEWGRDSTAKMAVFI